MGEALLLTLKIVGWLGIILGILVIVNTTTGVIYNISEKGEGFSWKKLLKGLGKAVIFYISASLLSIAFTMLPFINDMITDVFGIQLLSPDILNTLSTVSILGIIIYAIVAQGKKAVDGVKDLVGVSADVEKITWEVEDE
jgi:hypothetical protein